MRTVVALVLYLVAATAQAQVGNWNHFVQDEALEQAFHAALNQASFEYIQERQDEGRPAAILFLDAQRDVPLILTSSSFRHVLVAAAQARAAYVVDYQARTSAGVRVQIGPFAFFGAFAGGRYVEIGLSSDDGSGGEIPGDGAAMLSPVNSAGLTFTYGALAVASLDDAGTLRVDQDGADILMLRQRILDLTYQNYGHAPAD